MLPFTIYLLPMAASVVVIPPSKNYGLEIDNNTLKEVLFREQPILHLDLSNMNLHALEENAFKHVNVETLNLSNNSLTSLPQFVFSNQTKLKNLSLSNNQLSNVHALFVGLENLELLDISHNDIRHFRRSDLFGLPKSARILTDGNIFYSISTDVSTNPLTPILEPGEIVFNLSPVETAEEEITDISIEEENNPGTLNKDTRVKLCKLDGIVTSLEIFQKDEELAEGCDEVLLDVTSRGVNLQKKNITSFQEGWYRLQSLPIVWLDLSENEIAEIKEATLNDLPAGLTYVSFFRNKIHKIGSQVIDNEHLKSLNFGKNLIKNIEENAFEKTKLHQLYLDDNQLESLNFVGTLPDTLKAIGLNGNRATSIPDGVFSKLSHLVYLYLENNKIDKLQNNAFQGLISLHKLMLTRNHVTTIEPNAFKGMTTLKRIDLSHNSISDLRNDTFAELLLKELNLAWNKITKASFADLPSTLIVLYLDHNEIEALEEGSFVRVPRRYLSLSANRISSIARGAFDLPTLKDLRLNENNLTTIDGDSYEGLGHLRNLWLSENNITEILKGSCKNLGSLYLLDISNNPFHKLENGALYGLNITSMGSSVDIAGNNLKEMQAGLFEDV